MSLMTARPLEVSNGVRLQPLTSCDRGRFVELYSDNFDYLYAAGEVPGGVTAENCGAMFDWMCSDMRDGVSIEYGIQTDGTEVGYVGAFWIPEDDSVVKGHYWVDQHNQGNGYVTRSMRVMTDELFVTHSLIKAVEFDIFRGNVPSQKVATRLGAELAGGGSAYQVWRLRNECQTAAA